MAVAGNEAENYSAALRLDLLSRISPKPVKKYENTGRKFIYALKSTEQVFSQTIPSSDNTLHSTPIPNFIKIWKKNLYKRANRE